ncbi:MAG: DUF4369 domain-containing protein [Bacteroidales bacterium]|nr:DUF4369 domain-containing protein [Bacteroidales bacterium]
MKYKLRTFICLSLLLLGASACKHDGFTIEGTIEGGAGKSLWIEEIAPEGPIFIDSIRMDANGHFKYRYNPPYKSLYNLHTTENNYIVTLPSNGERIEVTGKYDNLSLTYNVKGSTESALLWQLQQYTNDGSKILFALVDSVNHYDALLAAKEIDNATYDALKATMDSIYHATFVEQQEYVCRFVEENAGSLSALIALYKPFNNRALIDPRDPVSIEYFDLVLEGLQRELPDNPHTLHFKNTTEHLRSALARQEEQ